jgi:hypothetical protein
MMGHPAPPRKGSLWNFQNMPYQPSTTGKIDMLLLLVVCIITGVKLVKVWRTAPPFRLKCQAQNPAYCQLLQTSAASLKQWIYFTFLFWGIFTSVSLYDVCVRLLNLPAFGGLLLINVILGFSTSLTAALLVVLFAFIVRWHIVKRIENLRNSD